MLSRLITSSPMSRIASSAPADLSIGSSGIGELSRAHVALKPSIWISSARPNNTHRKAVVIATTAIPIDALEVRTDAAACCRSSRPPHAARTTTLSAAGAIVASSQPAG